MTPLLRWQALPRLSRRAGVVGIVGLVLTAIGGWLDPDAFFQAWLVSWLFVLGLSLAAMMNAMIHELTGGEWGIVLRPPLEAAMLALPWCAVLALPLAFGLPHLFAWARPEAVAASEALQAKRWFLNTPGFLIRNAVWLIVWSAFAIAFGNRLSASALGDARAKRIAVAGQFVYLVTVTALAYDWIVSLVPGWSSTAIGVRLGSTQFLGAFAFAVVFAALAPDPRHAGQPPTARDFQDFGNLLLTFAMFWAYIAYMQFFIVWGEDLLRETTWYVPRLQTGWRWLAIIVLILDFALPFVAMLFRVVKRDRLALATVCAIVLAGQWLDTLWLTVPSLRRAGFALHWLDFAALAAEGGLWLAVVSAIVPRLATRRSSRDQKVRAHG
jgi:hypothetical protein